VWYDALMAYCLHVHRPYREENQTSATLGRCRQQTVMTVTPTVTKRHVFVFEEIDS
jgi:hypothetical protein